LIEKRWEFPYHLNDGMLAIECLLWRSNYNKIYAYSSGSKDLHSLILRDMDFANESMTYLSSKIKILRMRLDEAMEIHQDIAEIK